MAEKNINITNYENQLVGPDDLNYATIQSLPVPDNAINPFVVEKINDKDIKNIPMFTSLYGFVDVHQSRAALKISPGTYSFTIRGGGWKSTLKTYIPDVSLESGMQYLLNYEIKNSTIFISINRFSVDLRFPPTDKDHYIIGDAVSSFVKIETKK